MDELLSLNKEFWLSAPGNWRQPRPNEWVGIHPLQIIQALVTASEYPEKPQGNVTASSLKTTSVSLLLEKGGQNSVAIILWVKNAW